jgi:D-arabinose 1-dehydrogenase-like Zn-dependent alcohol dehydrogenase
MGERHYCEHKNILGYNVIGSCAQKIAVKADCALPIPDSISFESGALIACAAGTTWGAFSKLKPDKGETAAVWGLGPVGLCGIMIFKAMGVRVVGIGRRPSRLGLARELGAEEVVDIDNEKNIAEKVRDIFPGGASLAYEASGSADAQLNMMQSLGRFGKAVCVGLSYNEPSFNTRDIINQQLTIYGSHVLNYNRYDSFVEFIIKHSLQFDRIVTHRYAFEEGDKAFAMADSGDCGKVMLVDK